MLIVIDHDMGSPLEINVDRVIKDVSLKHDIHLVYLSLAKGKNDEVAFLDPYSV